MLGTSLSGSSRIRARACRGAARRSCRLPAVKLTVTVITRNESSNIAACLESVAWADEIIVVDSHSTDDTVAIARRMATRVEVRDWPGYGEQKNYAAAIASNDWILSVDADERVTTELAGEIRGADRRRIRVGRLSNSARRRSILAAGCAAPTGIPTSSCDSTTGARDMERPASARIGGAQRRTRIAAARAAALSV